MMEKPTINHLPPNGWNHPSGWNNQIGQNHYFHRVSNVNQWQELESLTNNFKNSFNLIGSGSSNISKKEKINGGELKQSQTTPIISTIPQGPINWFHVTSSQSWGEGVKGFENPIIEKEKVFIDVKKEEGTGVEESTENKDSLLWSFQNNIILPENVSKGINIEEELTRQDLYKTELCKSWNENGSCRYGEKCQFAHGSEELRPIFRHPKYKTEVCKTFHTYGTCPYGKRCRFVHHSPNEEFNPKEEKQTPTPTPKPKPIVVEEKKVLPQIDINKENKDVKLTKTKSPRRKKGSKLPFFQKLHKHENVS